MRTEGQGIGFGFEIDTCSSDRRVEISASASCREAGFCAAADDDKAAGDDDETEEEGGRRGGDAAAEAEMVGGGGREEDAVGEAAEGVG